MAGTFSIPCTIDKQGVLIPTKSWVKVAVQVKIDPKFEDEPVTGQIIWGNCIKAFITFDTTGGQVVGYHITDMSLNAEATRQSVENLLPYIKC